MGSLEELAKLPPNSLFSALQRDTPASKEFQALLTAVGGGSLSAWPGWPACGGKTVGGREGWAAHAAPRHKHQQHQHTHTCPPPPPPAQVRIQRSSFMRLRVSRRGDVSEAAFFSGLLEDRSTAGPSYVEYLCTVHRLIQARMA